MWWPFKNIKGPEQADPKEPQPDLTVTIKFPLRVKNNDVTADDILQAIRSSVNDERARAVVDDVWRNGYGTVQGVRFTVDFPRIVAGSEGENK